MIPSAEKPHGGVDFIFQQDFNFNRDLCCCTEAAKHTKGALTNVLENLFYKPFQ